MFDRVEEVNLDRLLHARARDGRLRRAKVEVAARALRPHRANPATTVDAYQLSVVEPEGFAAALDCDVLFSCVDRPWPRHVLNFAAYAHLVPVVDGGVAVDAGSGAIRGSTVGSAAHCRAWPTSTASASAPAAGPTPP